MAVKSKVRDNTNKRIKTFFTLYTNTFHLGLDRGIIFEVIVSVHLDHMNCKSVSFLFHDCMAIFFCNQMLSLTK